MKRLLGAFILAALLPVLLPGLARAQAPGTGTRDFKADAKALATRIDELLAARWADAGIKPAPLAADAIFLRRLFLDLGGRIPSLLDVRDFLDDDRPNKREIRLEELLASEAYARHFATIWRGLILQGATNQNQAQGLQFPFEQWLRQRLQNNVGYDKIVHELILSNPQGGGFNPGGGTGSPAAFFFANENKPENLAGATSRVFLGVKLECAQCHAHPFAKWKRDQFWEYAAFFSGMAGQPRRGGVPFNPNTREIKIPGTEKVVKAKFLDGAEPKWQDGVPTTRTLADWMIAAENPYFARAAVDHLWSYFFGVSLLEPIMEQNDDSPPTHPELLDELAKQFVAHNYDMKFLIRAIVQTQTYQRVSGTITAHKDEIHLFARMAIRGLTPEQFFDSIAEATEYQDPYANNPQMQAQQFNNGGQLSPRATFLQKFTSQDKRTETQTSILQALFMMNGKFLAERTKLENNKSLATIATASPFTGRRIETMYAVALSGLPQIPAVAWMADQGFLAQRRIETLYLLVLSRPPRPEEMASRVRYIDETAQRVRNLDASGARGERVEAARRQALSDVYWALLNSGEFMLNH